jgi:hydrogenase maturation protease
VAELLTKQVKRLVIGVGNEDRGDDAVGLLVASRLKPRADQDTKVIEWPGDAVSLMDLWKGADTMFIIDAAVSGVETGTIHRINVAAQPLPRDLLRYSTHTFSVAEAIELARALGELPREVVIYGIEGESFTAGAALSPAVENAAREVEDLVLADLEKS